MGLHRERVALLLHVVDGVVEQSLDCRPVLTGPADRFLARQLEVTCDVVEYVRDADRGLRRRAQHPEVTGIARLVDREHMLAGARLVQPVA